MTGLLERYGLDKLSDEEKRDVVEAIQSGLPDEYPNDEWPQWLCDLIDERLREAEENPGNCYTLDEFRRKLKEHRP